METKLKAYAEIKAQIEALEAERTALSGEIIAELKTNALEKVESPYGAFTVAHRTSWKYTPAVEKIEERLKIARVKEQQKGLAKPSVTDYLIYKASDA